jgi:hypothetical protein
VEDADPGVTQKRGQGRRVLIKIKSFIDQGIHQKRL